MWIVDDEFEDSLPLPRGERDIPLMIADRSFDRHNQLTDPFKGGLQPPADGIAGAAILVNGAFMPHHRVERPPLPAADPQRLPVPLLQPAPLQRRPDGPDRQRQRPDAAAGPPPRDPARAGRAGRGDRRLRRRRAARRSSCAAARHGGRNPDGARAYVGALMQFRVGPRPGRRTGPGSRAGCGRCREWAEQARKRRGREPDQRWEITVGGLFKTTWLINGRTFNPARADAFPELGTTEVWEIVQPHRASPT